MNSTKNEYRFTFKGTTRVIVTFHRHIWQSTPFVLINVIDFTCCACSNSTSSDDNLFAANSTCRVSMSWVIHICSALKHKRVPLLLKFATLNVRLSSNVIKIASSNHKYLALWCSNLNNLEIMREYVVLPLSVLRVDIVSGCVYEVEFGARPS
jgi:hypothetical protein